MNLTELTFHLEMSELKFNAPLNMPNMSITDETFQFERLELKLDAP